MTKTVFLIFTFISLNIIFCNQAIAQEEVRPLLLDSLKYNTCPKLYAGINIGAYTPNGFVGASIMYPLLNHLSGKTGVGWALWGYQVSQELILYAGSCNSQTALGIGLAYNTGRNNYKKSQKVLELNNGVYGEHTYDYYYKLDPVFLLNTNVYYFFNTGKRKNRLFVNLGWSFSITDINAHLERTTYTGYSAIAPDVKNGIANGLSLGIGYFLNVSKYPKRL